MPLCIRNEIQGIMVSKRINLVQFLMKMSTKYSLRKDIFNRCEITHEFLGSDLICLFSHTPVLHSFHSANEITSIGLCVHIPHYCTTPWSQVRCPWTRLVFWWFNTVGCFYHPKAFWLNTGNGEENKEGFTKAPQVHVKQDWSIKARVGNKCTRNRAFLKYDQNSQFRWQAAGWGVYGELSSNVSHWEAIKDHNFFLNRVRQSESFK